MVALFDPFCHVARLVAFNPNFQNMLSLPVVFSHWRKLSVVLTSMSPFLQVEFVFSSLLSLGTVPVWSIPSLLIEVAGGGCFRQDVRPSSWERILF